MFDPSVALSHKYFGTTVQNWLIAVGLALAVTATLSAAKRIAEHRIQQFASRTETRLDDLLVSLVSSVRLFFLSALGVWVASEYVHLSATAGRALGKVVTILALLQIGLSVQAAVRAFTVDWAAPTVDGEARTAASATAFLVSLAAWAVLIAMGLSTLGFEISALVAGLGVGGVAAALAVQNLLGDLFSSLSIYFDRPFHIGDFIIVGSEMGTVERIGLRSTRVRSLGGEEIVFANGDLTKSRIRNYKRMTERRVAFGFGVEYGTKLEQLREIPALVKRIVEAYTDTRFDRAHFKEYGSFSLNFEVVYYVLSPEYNVYMDRQQAINLELFQQFADRGIQFAFPTQKLLLSPEKPISIARD